MHAWKLSFHNPSLDIYGDLIITVFRVKMRWRMIPIEHADHNSKEAADFRHRIAVSSLLVGRTSSMDVAQMISYRF